MTEGGASDWNIMRNSAYKRTS